MAERVSTNNQRGRRLGPCRLWGGLDKARHIVTTAFLVRVHCFSKGLYKAVEVPSTRPIVLSMINGSSYRRRRRFNYFRTRRGFVTCGVPQGSILGPLLFLIYVNDMTTSIDKDCKLILYADDSAIFFAHKDPHLISEKLGSVLDNCSTWLVNNKLSLHLGKTECILFGPKRKLKYFHDFTICCICVYRQLL